jgi:branched-chain amino acid transport system ATP-binding protein
VAVLELTDIFAGYGQADILRGVDLALEPGTITCIVGPNGAGKSTVLKTLSGLLHPRRGTIILHGQKIGGLNPRRVLEAGIVHVPQDRSLFPLMTVWENVLLGAYVLRDGREARRRLEAVAERFPLVRERAGDRAGSLSGGQQKIVEIARALMLEPKVILMDEPSMGLDPKARTQVFETVVELNREGHTVLLVEQNARSGLAISHRAVVMDAGTIALEGAADRLLSDPNVAALYLGGHVQPPTADRAAPSDGARPVTPHQLIPNEAR